MTEARQSVNIHLAYSKDEAAVVTDPFHSVILHLVYAMDVRAVVADTRYSVCIPLARPKDGSAAFQHCPRRSLSRFL